DIHKNQTESQPPVLTADASNPVGEDDIVGAGSGQDSLPQQAETHARPNVTSESQNLEPPTNSDDIGGSADTSPPEIPADIQKEPDDSLDSLLLETNLPYTISFVYDDEIQDLPPSPKRNELEHTATKSFRDSECSFFEVEKDDIIEPATVEIILNSDQDPPTEPESPTKNIELSPSAENIELNSTGGDEFAAKSCDDENQISLNVEEEERAVSGIDTNASSRTCEAESREEHAYSVKGVTSDHRPPKTTIEHESPPAVNLFATYRSPPIGFDSDGGQTSDGGFTSEDDESSSEDESEYSSSDDDVEIIPTVKQVNPKDYGGYTIVRSRTFKVENEDANEDVADEQIIGSTSGFGLSNPDKRKPESAAGGSGSVGGSWSLLRIISTVAGSMMSSFSTSKNEHSLSRNDLV
ncbi:MAG: hypothetical protein O7C56_09160, partial [Rickettsia endosymbiont of Ixodes persulcatus]|nr:hypothetical protein [Rickettsia endosymbiont of Ixodes persulcatus]